MPPPPHGGRGAGSRPRTYCSRSVCSSAGGGCVHGAGVETPGWKVSGLRLAARPGAPCLSPLPLASTPVPPRAVPGRGAFQRRAARYEDDDGGGGRKGGEEGGRGGLLRRDAERAGEGAAAEGRRGEAGREPFAPPRRRPVPESEGRGPGAGRGGGGGPGCSLARSRGGAAGALGPVPPGAEAARRRERGGRPSCHLQPLPSGPPPPPAAGARRTDKPPRETRGEGDDY